MSFFLDAMLKWAQQFMKLLSNINKQIELIELQRPKRQLSKYIMYSKR